MRIGVNLRYLQKRISGIERTILELVKRLADTEEADQVVGYITNSGFVSTDVERELRACPTLELKTTRLLRDDSLFRLLWDVRGVGHRASADALDVFWGPSFSLPHLSDPPGVVTVYDLAFMRFPNAFDWRTRLWHRMITTRSARRAAAVMTISENSRRDIVRYLGVPVDRVHVVPLACDEQFRQVPLGDAVSEAVLERLGVRRPFLLTVSQISRRKNLAHLVRVYAELRRDRKTSHQLVLAGANGWLCGGVHEAVRRERMEAHIVFAGAVSDQELLLLYNAADVLVYPSLYEGFGLPVLEAMACGLPVIASDASSLPEVVADAGILVPPVDGAALGAAILRVSEDRGFHAELSGRGLERAAQFSWARSGRIAREILARGAERA
jgi:glycosyltransferase involved in cell wall biosynthesis